MTRPALDVTGAAAFLAVSPDTVRQLAREGKIPAAKGAGKLSFLDVRATAAFFNVSPGTITNLARAGKIPARKYRGRWRFFQKEIEVWFRQKCSGARLAALSRKQARERAATKPKREISYALERYRKLKLATPAWANVKAIAKIYARAQAISKKSGIKHHVDHIIPLNGITVCGLHVQANLRIIPSQENLRRPRIFRP